MSLTNRNWKSNLVGRYPALFDQVSNGRVTAPGIPTVGDGWRELVETAIERIAAALASDPGGSLQIGQIKEKFGTVRIYVDGQAGLSRAVSAAIAEAICLAEARSACICEQCGAPGRLFKSGGSYLTTCDAHGSGKPARRRDGLENVHIGYVFVDGERVLRARRYLPAVDAFEEVDLSDLNLYEE
jgi:hypothetical protein